MGRQTEGSVWHLHPVGQLYVGMSYHVLHLAPDVLYPPCICNVSCANSQSGSRVNIYDFRQTNARVKSPDKTATTSREYFYVSKQYINKSSQGLSQKSSHGLGRKSSLNISDNTAGTYVYGHCISRNVSQSGASIPHPPAAPSQAAPRPRGPVWGHGQLTRHLFCPSLSPSPTATHCVPAGYLAPSERYPEGTSTTRRSLPKRRAVVAPTCGHSCRSLPFTSLGAKHGFPLLHNPPQSWVSLVSLFTFPHADWIGPNALGPCSCGKKAGSLAEQKEKTLFTTKSGTFPCQGPSKFTLFGSFSPAFRVAPFRLPLSGPVKRAAAPQVRARRRRSRTSPAPSRMARCRWRGKVLHPKYCNTSIRYIIDDTLYCNIIRYVLLYYTKNSPAPSRMARCRWRRRRQNEERKPCGVRSKNRRDALFVRGERLHAEKSQK